MTLPTLATWLRTSFVLAASVTACGVTACGDASTLDAPVLSSLVIQSPLQSDATSFAGSVHVTDPAGLDSLTLNVTVTTPAGSETLPVPITSTVLGQTEATVHFALQQKTWIMPGTQQVAVTAVEVDTPSNTLSATMVIE